VAIGSLALVNSKNRESKKEGNPLEQSSETLRL
jgi:hypothetical protein